jgi:N-methylhydantoinase A
MRLGVDIGGTFTDFVLEGGDRQWRAKVLTTPQAPEEAVLAGMDAILAHRT